MEIWRKARQTQRESWFGWTGNVYWSWCFCLLTRPFLCHHPETICFVLPLKCVQVQDTRKQTRFSSARHRHQIRYGITHWVVNHLNSLYCTVHTKREENYLSEWSEFPLSVHLCLFTFFSFFVNRFPNDYYKQIRSSVVSRGWPQTAPFLLRRLLCTFYMQSRCTKNYKHNDLEGNSKVKLSVNTCMTAWVPISSWKIQHLFCLSGSSTFSSIRKEIMFNKAPFCVNSGGRYVFKLGVCYHQLYILS